MIEAFKGWKITLMGLGRFGGGVGVARWLAEQGADVLVTDREPAEKLAESIAQLQPFNFRFRLSGHNPADFRDIDLLVVNPAVPERSEFVQIAREAGVPITTEINLFLERCPAPIIGVTGSVGKSTITAMIGHILTRTADESQHFSEPGAEAPAGRAGKTWVGGNIGVSLLDRLPEIQAHDRVVLELSSFQLYWTAQIRWSPQVAVISNITPNHLDWHESFEAYRDAKLNIVRFADDRQHVVVRDEPALIDAVFAAHPEAKPWAFRLQDHSGRARRIGASSTELSFDALQLSVPGDHNRLNAVAALTACVASGTADIAALQASLRDFSALPHRLELVAERNGTKWYDDSKSTTPEAAITALNSFREPLLLILGGYDKGSDLAPVARLAAQRTRFVACIGQTGPRIAQLVREAGGVVENCGDLPHAVAACRERAKPGDVILLSPACASWGQFTDYRERGDLFARLARGQSAS